MAKQKQAAQEEEIDFSGFAGEDSLIDDTPGLNISRGIEIESIEDINKGIEEVKKAQEKEVEEKKVEESEEKEIEEEDKEKVEEEPKPKKEKKIEKVEEESKEETESSPIVVFCEFLAEKGIIARKEGEQFEDNEEYLLKKIEEKIETGIEEYKESFSPEAREIIDAVEAGIPADAILQRNAAIDTYESLTDAEIEGNEALQRSLLRNVYQLNGYSKDLIEKKIKRLDDAGVMAEEAKDARDELKEAMIHQKEQMKETQKQEESKKVKAIEEWKANIKTTLDKTDEIIPGLKISDTQKKTVFEGLTKIDAKGKNELRKMIDADPMFDLKVAYIALALKWDFSAFDKKAMTEATKKLRASIESSQKMRSSDLGVERREEKSGVDFKTIEKALKTK